MSDEQESPTQAKAEAETAGIMEALIKYLPKLIVSCGLALVGAVSGYTHLQESRDHAAEVKDKAEEQAKESNDTATVWKHSGAWSSNIMELQLEVKDLRWNVRDLKDEVNQLRQEQNQKGK